MKQLERYPIRLLLAASVAAVATAALPAVATADFQVGVDVAGLSLEAQSQRDAAAPLLGSTGAKLFRAQIYWNKIAPDKRSDLADPANPASPGYRWASTDHFVRTAAAAGGEALLNPFMAPTWAEGPNRPTTGYGKSLTSPPYEGSWNPSAADYGAFARALAKRYDGTTNDPLRPGFKLPKVRYFEAWNEPNYQMFLSPQCSKGRMVYGNVCSSGGKLVAPANYRLLLNAFYDGVKAAQPDATVTAGSFGPYGNSSQGFEIDPQVLARNIMCLGGTAANPTPLAASACPVKAKFDALSFHPYTLGGTPTTKASSSNGGSLGNAPDFRRALDRATAAGTVLPAGPKQLWETETGWMTCPPCRTTTSATASIGIGPTLATQYTSEMIYRAWSWGVSKVFWYGPVDMRGWPGGRFYRCAAAATTNLAECSSATLADAVAKPVMQGFRFPLFAAKASATTAFAWAMSPCKVPGSTLRFEVLNSKTKAWSALNVPGPIDPKTKKPTSIPLVLTLPAGTDGTIKSSAWTIPTSTTSIRATASGTGCSTETSVAMPIASK